MERKKEYLEAVSFVTKLMGVTEDELANRSRTTPIPLSKHLISYYLKSKFNLTLHEIKDVIGYRSHQSVMHSCSYIEDNSKCNLYLQILKDAVDSKKIPRVMTLRREVHRIISDSYRPSVASENIIMLFKAFVDKDLPKEINMF